MNLFIVAPVLLACVISPAMGAYKQCSTPDVTDATCICEGQKYDFSRVALPTTEIFETTRYPYKYFFQMTPAGIDPGRDQGCEKSNNGGARVAVIEREIDGNYCYDIGTYSKQTWEIDSESTPQRIKIEFTAPGFRKSEVTFICSHDKIPTFSFDGKPSINHFGFTVTTAAACSSQPPSPAPAPPSPSPPHPSPPSPSPPHPSPPSPSPPSPSPPSPPGSVVYIAPYGEDKEGYGTKDRPFATLTYAVTSEEKSITVYVMPGVYSDSKNFPDLHKAGLPETITIVAEDTTLPPRQYLFHRQGCTNCGSMYIRENVTISSLAFTGYQSTSYAIIIAAGGGLVEACEFYENTQHIAVYSTKGKTILSKSRFDLDNGKSGATAIDWKSTITYSKDNVVEAIDCEFNGVGLGVAVRLNGGTFIGRGVTANNLATVIQGSSSHEYDVEVYDSQFYKCARGLYAYGFSDGKYVANVRFENVNIENGMCLGCDGTAVHIGKNVKMNILNSHFLYNNASLDSSKRGGNGGAVYCQEGATMNMVDSRIEGNVAHDGGAGYCEKNCAFLATRVVSLNNHAENNTMPCTGLNGATLKVEEE
eukprot:m.11964 g.11964  ORF g.11964 m.11964 type:complete len:590 (-) comp4564_c1_seq1:86-1855(-)